MNTKDISQWTGSDLPVGSTNHFREAMDAVPPTDHFGLVRLGGGDICVGMYDAGNQLLGLMSMKTAETMGIITEQPRTDNNSGAETNTNGNSDEEIL